MSLNASVREFLQDHSASFVLAAPMPFTDGGKTSCQVTTASSFPRMQLGEVVTVLANIRLAYGALVEQCAAAAGMSDQALHNHVNKCLNDCEMHGPFSS